jgi:hypothetical protein
MEENVRIEKANMKLTNSQKAILASYGRSILGAGLATYVATNSLVASLNALWAAAIPVLLRYLNPSDPAFGRKADSAE